MGAPPGLEDFFDESTISAPVAWSAGVIEAADTLLG
jgi:hypothetical protein